MTTKYWKKVETNSVNPLYLNFSKVNEDFEKTNKNKCLMPVIAIEDKNNIKKI